MQNIRNLLFILACLGVSLQAQPFSWLGEPSPDSRTLRVSLYCTQCLDLLNAAYTQPPTGGTPPLILLQYYGEEDLMTPLFVSATLHAAGDTPQERFLLPFSLLMQAYQNRQTYGDAMKRIQEFVPQASAKDPQALAILQAQQEALAKLENRGTPAIYLTGETLPRQADPRSVFGLWAEPPPLAKPLRGPNPPPAKP